MLPGIAASGLRHGDHDSSRHVDVRFLSPLRAPLLIPSRAHGPRDLRPHRNAFCHNPAGRDALAPILHFAPGEDSN
jgi:hypothetical protein